MTSEDDKKQLKESTSRGKSASRTRASSGSSRARSVGSILKEKRLEKKISLNEVVADLRIQKDYITSIESGSHEGLPALPYACGFVKSYATYLDFDGDEIVAKFKKEAESLLVESNSIPVPPVLRTEDAVPTGKILGMSLLVLVVIYSAWSIFSSPSDVQIDPDLAIESDVTALPDITDIDAGSGGNLGVSLGEDAETTLSKVEEGLKIPVTIYAENDSWVEVTDYQSKVLMSRILKEGETYQLPNQTGLKLATGNAGEIVIKVGEKTVPSIGGVGVVKRNISVDQLIQNHH